MKSPDELGKNIDKVLSSDKIKEILKEIGKESKSIGRTSEIIGDIYTYMFVHQDSYKVNEYIAQINEAYKKIKGNPKEMAYIRGKLLADSISEKLGISKNNNDLESQEKIKSYFLKNYVENGYVTHSFNGASYFSIKENGFSSNKRNWDNQEVLDIAQIFSDKGVIAPVGGYSHYSGKGLYVEHNQQKAFWHSVGGPEWFKWFTSSTHNENSTKIEDSPYYLKDYDACKQNVIDLCDNSNVSEKEKIRVESFFDKMWKILGTTDTYTALIPKSVIGKNSPENAIIPNKDAIGTIISVLNDERKEYVEHGGNCFAGEIPIDKVIITKMPNAQEIFGNRTYTRETKNQLFDEQKVAGLKARVESGKQIKENKGQKGTFVSYQMAEAIELLDKYDISNVDEQKSAEAELQQLKARWLMQDEIPGYNQKIGDRIAGMQSITLDEIEKISEDIKKVDTYSAECIGNMQYCLVKDGKGNVDFDFSYLEKIANLARKNGKKMIVDSAIVFGDRFPENMANMSKEEIEGAISLYTQKLTTKFGDCIDRIDVLNSVFQRNDIYDRTGTLISEQFWINMFGDNYASKVLGIVKENCQNQDIKLCWNEFYITNKNDFDKHQEFIKRLESTSNLDVIGLQDNFRADTSCEYIQSSLERMADVCRKSGKKLCITELSCKVGRKDIETLNEAKQRGNYSEKVGELNNRISRVLRVVDDFSDKNKNVVLAVESRYSDKYDCNHLECEKYGHNIHTNPRYDNINKRENIWKSAV